MYRVENGFLHKDGKRLFVLGESYYPSFHPSKFPVKPEDDRYGEMEKDLKMMAQAGFNHVRFAALGEASYDENTGKVCYHGDFVDAMTREAGNHDLSVSVRLQGFSVNLRGFEDAQLLDQNGNTPDFAWSDFVRSTLNHPGILEDNHIYAKDLAAHFAAFDNVVGYQIYNEPKYPQPMAIICDYNPMNIAAFRKWLVKNSILDEADAAVYEPPRGRRDQSPEAWARWRMFSMETLTAFLNGCAEGAKEGGNLPTFTCLTADTFCKTNPRRGVDPFGNAKGMELVGYTIYKHAWGADYYPMCLEGDTFQCAAESEGKQAWCIELDSRTYIPSDVYNKGTYATIGSGVKGIVYYQWRGDQPVPGVPHPNSCGILNFDGTKTDNFENAVRVNQFISSVNDLLVNAERAKEGIGLLYSPYANALADGICNSEEEPRGKEYYNSYIMACQQLYAQLREVGYTVTVTDAEHLESGSVRVLIVPDSSLLSAQERQLVESFQKKGGQVYANIPTGRPTRGYCGLQEYTTREKSYKERVFDPYYTPWDLEVLTGIRPMVRSLTPNVGAQVLQGADYTLVVLTHFSPVTKRTDAQLRLSIPFGEATFTAIDGDRPVEICGDILTIRDITDGGILILK